MKYPVAPACVQAGGVLTCVSDGLKKYAGFGFTPTAPFPPAEQELSLIATFESVSPAPTPKKSAASEVLDPLMLATPVSPLDHQYRYPLPPALESIPSLH
jgi:hypothetical protein